MQSSSLYLLIVLFDSSIKKLNKLVISHLVNWLNVNKIKLNVKKHETVIIKPKQKKLEGDLKMKLSG